MGANRAFFSGFPESRRYLEAPDGGADLLLRRRRRGLHGRRRRQRRRPRPLLGHEGAGKRQVPLQRRLPRQRGIAPQQHVPGMNERIRLRI